MPYSNNNYTNYLFSQNLDTDTEGHTSHKTVTFYFLHRVYCAVVSTNLVGLLQKGVF